MLSYQKFKVAYFQNTLATPSASDSLLCYSGRLPLPPVKVYCKSKIQPKPAAIMSEFIVIFVTTS